MRMTFVFCLLLSSILISSTAKADTIYLKNGSVIKGKVASFADDQFVVVLDTGSSRFVSRAQIYIADVSRIEFDGAPATAGESSPRDATPQREPVSVVTVPSNPTGRNPGATDSGDSGRDSAKEQTKEPAKDPAKEPEHTERAGSTTTPQPEASEPPPSRKPTGPVKTANVEVAAKRDWTSTGLIVKRGDRIRISATGSVILDPTTQQASGPEGVDISDARKLMSDRPTGALIGVIGADNDDFIFVGRNAEFTAARDGLLFLSVNEGALSDNSGSYKAAIEVQAQTGRRQ